MEYLHKLDEQVALTYIATHARLKLDLAENLHKTN